MIPTIKEIFKKLKELRDKNPEAIASKSFNFHIAITSISKSGILPFERDWRISNAEYFGLYEKIMHQRSGSQFHSEWEMIKVL